jgi:hypothetical protein
VIRLFLALRDRAVLVSVAERFPSLNEPAPEGNRRHSSSRLIHVTMNTRSATFRSQCRDEKLFREKHAFPVVGQAALGSSSAILPNSGTVKIKVRRMQYSFISYYWIFELLLIV